MIYNAYSEQNENISGITFVSCGHVLAKNGREIFRPYGRNDWLLFFVATENETFFLEKEEIANAGSFIIFAPHEKQHHIYKGNKTAEFYYVHFKCEQLPKDINLKTSKIIFSFVLNYCNCLVISIKNSLLHKSNFDLSLTKGSTSSFACAKSILENLSFNNFFKFSIVRS